MHDGVLVHLKMPHETNEVRKSLGLTWREVINIGLQIARDRAKIEEQIMRSVVYLTDTVNIINNDIKK